MKTGLSDTTIQHFDNVICGGGPGGLFTALRLWQNGARSILIISPIMGPEEYTRTGAVDPDVIKHIEYLIRPFKLNVSPERHIKDIERGLYSIIKEKTNIVLAKKKFVSINKNQIHQFDEKTKEKSVVTARFLYDCTGIKRLVVNEINGLNPESPPFLITRPEEKKEDAHFATLRTKLEDIKDTETIGYYRYYPSIAIEKTDPLKYVGVIEDLQKLGWAKFTAPYAYFIIAVHDQIGTKSAKATLHMQIAQHMQKDEIIKHANLVAKLASYKEELSLAPLTFKKDALKSEENKKPVAVSFEFHPGFVTPGYYQDTTHDLTVFPCFDCLANLPFTTGSSLDYGVLRMEYGLSCSVFEKGVVKEVLFSQYAQTVQEAMISYQKRLKEYYENLDSFYLTQMLPALTQYQRALQKSIDESQKAKLVKDIAALQSECDTKLAVTHYKEFFSRREISEDPLKNKLLQDLLLKLHFLNNDVNDIEKNIKILIYLKDLAEVPEYKGAQEILKQLSKQFLKVFLEFRKLNLSDAHEIKKCNELLNMQIAAISAQCKILKAYSEIPSSKIKEYIERLNSINQVFQAIEATLKTPDPEKPASACSS